jgi:hypothetical protein
MFATISTAASLGGVRAGHRIVAFAVAAHIPRIAFHVATMAAILHGAAVHVVINFAHFPCRTVLLGVITVTVAARQWLVAAPI